MSEVLTRSTGIYAALVGDNFCFSSLKLGKILEARLYLTESTRVKAPSTVHGFTDKPAPVGRGARR